MRDWLLLLVLLFVLNVADVLLTHYGLALGAVELNPLYDHQSMAGKLLATVGFAAVWALTYLYCEHYCFRKATAFLRLLLYTLVGLYGLVDLNNLIQLTLLEG